MVSPGDLQQLEDPSRVTVAVQPSEVFSSDLGKDLVFTQDDSGRYLSFSWLEASRYGLQVEAIVGSWISDQFGPIAITPYLEAVQQVLSTGVPQQFNYPFRCGEYELMLDLVLSPVLVPNVRSTIVIGVAQLLPGSVRLKESVQLGETPEPAAAGKPSLAGQDAPVPFYLAEPNSALSMAPSDRYQRLLALISWNIRRTLDLETIWQQTVQGLGKALNLSRCIICPYQKQHDALKVVAEYCRGSSVSWLGREFLVSSHPFLSQVLAELAPKVMNLSELEGEVADSPLIDAAQVVAPLIVATCYQHEPNGLLCLYRHSQEQQWTEVEMELMRELSDQVGTAIAHATLFAESQSLASEVQKVNVSLLQKHRELEEAHQQAEEASRLKSEFLANTSHELRTPLNGIIGFLKLVMDGMADDPEEQTTFLQEAHRSALHLLDVINDILDIAKIEAGKMQLELSPVKLEELMLRIDSTIRPQSEQRGLFFTISVPKTRDDIIVFGNYQRLLQVLLNLVGNAIKFTHEGGITISVEIVKKKVLFQNQEFPGMVKVRVADTGIGVSLDKQDKLFQSFSQVDGSRTRKYGGTGLGLAISQTLVDAMGGVVNFYSMGEGLGSTVTFTVPLYQEPLLIASQSSDSIDLLL